MAQPITQPHLLLVEGRDEENFFDALFKHIGIKTIEIRQTGKYSFRQKLKDITMQSGFEIIESIGIVRDADDRSEDAFKSICDSLKSLNLPYPNQILIPSRENPQITILIMPPNNEGTGRMLEDLCFASVENDLAIQCVEQYFECLGQQGVIFRKEVLAKAKIHAFLASRQEPDKRLGEAAQANYWNFESAVFDAVKTFVQQVAKL